LSEIAATSATEAGNKPTKEIRIIVNAEPKIVDSNIVSYEEVVRLAYPTPPAPNTYYTVTFRNAEGRKVGSLIPGQSVEVRDEGTIFDVTPTGRS